MPSFLNAIRKLPGLVDPERLMKTPDFMPGKSSITPEMMPPGPMPQLPSFSGGMNNTAMLARQNVGIAPPPAGPESFPTLGGPSQRSVPVQPPPPVPVAEIPSKTYGTVKDEYRLGRTPITREAITGLEDQYMQERGQKRGWKGTLMNALGGALQGIATTGSVGGGIGGGIAGAASSLISPKAGARLGFNLYERPELEQMYGQQQQERQQSLAERLKQQQILNQQAQMQQRQAQAERAARPEAPRPIQRDLTREFGVLDNEGNYTAKIPGQPKPEQPKMGWVTQPDGSRKWSVLTPDTVSSPDPAMGLDLWAKREGILGQLRRDQQDRQKFPLEMQKLQKDLNEPPSGSSAKGLTPQTRAKYFGEMKDAIEEFQSMIPKQGGRPDDPQLLEAMRQLQARFGEDIEVAIGDGGYPYAKPRMVQVGDPQEQEYVTVRELREQMRSAGLNNDQITNELRKRKIIQ